MDINDGRLVASTLDNEPLVYKGVTYSEVKLFVLLCFVPNVIIGAILGLLFSFILTIFFSLVGTLLLFMFVAGYLKNAKRSKPPGYYLQVIAIYMSEKLGIGLKFIRTTCHWHSRRSR